MTTLPTDVEATGTAEAAEGHGPTGPDTPAPYRGAWASAAAGVAMVVMAPVFIYLVDHPTVPFFGVHDFKFHLDLADTMSLWPPRLTMPHPVFHVLLRLLDPVLGRPAAAVTVLLAAIGVMAVALVRIFSTPAHQRAALAPATAAALTVAYFLTESPNLALQEIGLIPPQPFTPVHIWGNPTETVALAAALLLLPAVVVLIDRLAAGAPVGRHGPAVAALAIISALAKPSLMLVLAPAAIIHLAASRAWSRRTVLGVIGWLGVPGAAVIVWQTWFLEAAGSSQYKTGFTWDPFALIHVYGWDRGGVAYWIPVLVPVSAAVVGRKRFWSERSVALTLWSLLIAIVPLLFMRETGERPYDGNLAKSSLYCWMLLWVLSVRFWALEARDGWRARSEGMSWVLLAIAVLGGLALVSGVLALLGGAGLITLPDAWSGNPV